MIITLVPYAGLCNRLNAIVSGLAYKEKHPEIDFRILWYKYWHCRCQFSDLFKQLPARYVPVEELTWQVKDIPGHRFNLNLPQLIRPLWYDCSILPGMSADAFDILTERKNSVYIYHDNRFCKRDDSELNVPYSEIFRPTDELQTRINAVTKDWDRCNVVGLHIRRTDNVGAITGSPNEFFYNAIESEIEQQADTRFYVASDDESVKKDLLYRYDKHIITIPLCLKRNSIQGMKDAVVDLFCLGSTRKIYGSKSSSYSTFAAKLFGVDVIK